MTSGGPVQLGREGMPRRLFARTTPGAAVHVARAQWWAEPRARRTPAGARAPLERYVATPDPDDEPVAVERTVHARTQGLALSGRVDRIHALVGGCTWCDVRRLCPADQAAAPSRRPGDGLPCEPPVPDAAA